MLYLMSLYASHAFSRLRPDERGQGAAEYAIVTILIVGAVGVIAGLLSGALTTAYDAVSNAITDAV